MFNIPKAVKIGGINYQVILAEKWVESGGDDGQLDLETNIIYINSKLSQEAKEVTFIHECLHAMNSTIDHVALDSLAEQLYQLIADNAF